MGGLILRHWGVQSDGLAQSCPLLQPTQFFLGNISIDSKLEKDTAEYMGGISWELKEILLSWGPVEVGMLHEILLYERWARANEMVIRYI